MTSFVSDMFARHINKEFQKFKIKAPKIEQGITSLGESINKEVYKTKVTATLFYGLIK